MCESEDGLKCGSGAAGIVMWQSMVKGWDVPLGKDWGTGTWVYGSKCRLWEEATDRQSAGDKNPILTLCITTLLPKPFA